jgi:hypothetical protein
MTAYQFQLHIDRSISWVNYFAHNYFHFSSRWNNGYTHKVSN